MWIVWVFTIPIWLICLVVFMTYAVFDAYGKYVVSIINIIFFVFFLISILGFFVLLFDTYRGVIKKKKDVNITDNLKCILIFTIYMLFYGGWFIKNYIM